MLLELSGSRYLALLPMTSEVVNGQFFIEDGSLQLKSRSLGAETVTGEVPLVIWAYGNSPYASTQAVWEQVFESGFVAAQARAGELFPEEPYGYLGWCSWKFYKTNISEKILADAVHTIENCGAPIRWFIVDNGYLNQKKSMLFDFTPDVRCPKTPLPANCSKPTKVLGKCQLKACWCLIARHSWSSTWEMALPLRCQTSTPSYSCSTLSLKVGQ